MRSRSQVACATARLPWSSPDTIAGTVEGSREGQWSPTHEVGRDRWCQGDFACAGAHRSLSGTRRRWRRLRGFRDWCGWNEVLRRWANLIGIGSSAGVAALLLGQPHPPTSYDVGEGRFFRGVFFLHVSGWSCGANPSEGGHQSPWERTVGIGCNCLRPAGIGGQAERGSGGWILLRVGLFCYEDVVAGAGSLETEVARVASGATVGT